MRTVQIPSMLRDLVSSAILSVEGITFTSLDACSYCGGPVKGHDMRRKRFATIRTKNGKKTVHVFVKRYHCEQCGRLCYAESPFYPDTRLGIPIVDLCNALIEKHPYHHAARILAALEIVVDRGTLRNYAQRSFPPPDVIEMYGVPIPISILNMNEQSFRGKESGSVPGAEVFGPGGLPPAARAFLFSMGGSGKRNQRNK
ncbi:hypothetical protein L1S32_05270 [Methanogenium sp. S4BF]|uniref:hypothetical protein n=1 Tax=Methanogenium sp. S4BF TaxID=1789226 RepID=UPI00241682BB|nr:hypothetical protein [Methanogenium sp. S4BF]WFN35515.1 hypothetical protein L1S32_05270 [Methanogenium sp. S4BF]